MATSRNSKIQQLMDEVDALDGSDEHLEAKLQQIAEAVAAERGRMRPRAPKPDAPIDPSDAFACEGCQ